MRTNLNIRLRSYKRNISSIDGLRVGFYSGIARSVRKMVRLTTNDTTYIKGSQRGVVLVELESF